METSLNAKLHRLFIESRLYTGPNSKNYIKEIEYYIRTAFGSKTRLDYGTGHELSYLAFLGALWMSDVLTNMDGTGFLILFGKYYDLVRSLILTYTLEPAGSHGVWGLDDHFHLSYLLGCSQLVNVAELDDASNKLSNMSSSSQQMLLVTPQSVVDRAVVDQYKLKNLYFNSVAFIYKVKNGPFWETSPILYDISGVKTWKKILVGLQKMYNVEVLAKFPVIQHFWFGGVFYPWIDATTRKELPTTSISASEETPDVSAYNAKLPRFFEHNTNSNVRDNNVSDKHKLNLMAGALRPPKDDFDPVTTAIAPLQLSSGSIVSAHCQGPLATTAAPWAASHRKLVNQQTNNSKPARCAYNISERRPENIQK